jgi:pimeloyl-ACP methyl ester carboxylesterase
VLDNATHVNDAIEQAERYVDPLTGEHPPVQLWLYDAEKFGTDNGAVALSVGDLDAADNLAVRVSGITTDIDDISGLTAEATNVYESARFNGDGENSVASMIWLGYDAPGGVTDPATLTEHRAQAGGEELAQDIDGLRGSRDDRAHLTVLGHSYGSTTMARGAGDHGLDVDDLVFLGSPGGGFDRSGDLGIEEEQVWAGRNSRDIVGTLGDHGWFHPGNVGAGLGRDPADEDFGSTRFTAEDQGRSAMFRGTEAHGNYFNQDTESLHNLGRIVDGDDSAVQAAAHVHDPFLGGPEDPEIDRDDIQAPDTGNVRHE